MGVTVLQQFPILDNKTGPQTIDFLTKRILALGALASGNFVVDCESYSSVPMVGPPRSLHVLHNSEHPASVFSVMESAQKTVSLVTDPLYDLLLLKMQAIYTSKKQTRCEAKGPRFELVDFCIKIGSVTMNQSFKGVLVEVEYGPCVVPSACWELIREFLQGFLGSCVSSTPPPYLQNRFNELYQPIDTIHQYLEQFTAYRKATGVR